MDLQNKRKSEKILWGLKKEKNLEWACLKVPLAVSVTLSRRHEATIASKSKTREYIYIYVYI